MKRSSLVAVGSCVLLLLSVRALIKEMSKLTYSEVTNAVIIDIEFRSFSLALVMLVSCILFSDCIRFFRQQRLHRCTEEKSFTPLHSMLGWISGLLVVNTLGWSSQPAQSVSSRGVPIDDALSPMAGTAVVAHIIRRRREQIENRFTPDVLTREESEALARIVETSHNDSRISSIEGEYIVTPDVHTVITAVDRELQSSTQNCLAGIDSPWLVEVKLFGYPMVVAVDGTVAEFRKKRALELLTWLTLNRDRARRSTARTALWDLDVTDSSFSTVVSDLRRALREAVGNRDVAEFLPTTYSDELPLSHMVTTDADRLQRAYVRLKETHVIDDEMRLLLRGMRDIPLAGTSYSWADLDGTTTRLVMSALAVTVDVARIGIEIGNIDDAVVATAAGLRVFPGCEELLDLQKLCLQRVASS